MEGAMIDLHTHTVFSDGALIPAELARRAKKAGYQALAFTDHADESLLEHVIVNLKRFTATCGHYYGLDLFAGVEITHVAPALIGDHVARARKLGAELVVVHGETVVEPVARGTNLAAIEAGADILAHPGLISVEEVRLAAEAGVALEITTRGGHSLANGHVAALAREHGAALVVNNDAHAPGDLVGPELRRAVALGAGMTENELAEADANARRLVERILT
jgi:histidinol phosphatase-like PHP family hydrolase